MAAAVAFVFGAIAGSFANVLIHRLPRGESIVAPGSRCSACGAPIRWRDNVPLLSYALLRGRCRDCGARISPRYPAVELAVGALFAWLAWRPGPGLEAARLAILGCALVVAAATDVERGVIPDALTAPGYAAGVACGFLAGHGIASLAGGAAVAALMLLARWASRGGLGFGDVKAGAMIGTFLGPRAGLAAVCLGAAAGVAAWCALAAMGRRPRGIPFAPALAAGALAAVALLGPDF